MKIRKGKLWRSPILGKSTGTTLHKQKVLYPNGYVKLVTIQRSVTCVGGLRGTIKDSKRRVFKPFGKKIWEMY